MGVSALIEYWKVIKAFKVRIFYFDFFLQNGYSSFITLNIIVRKQSFTYQIQLYLDRNYVLFQRFVFFPHSKKFSDLIFHLRRHQIWGAFKRRSGDRAIGQSSHEISVLSNGTALHRRRDLQVSNFNLRFFKLEASKIIAYFQGR